MFRAILGLSLAGLVLAAPHQAAAGGSYCDNGTWVHTYVSGNAAIIDNSGHTRLVNGSLSSGSNSAVGDSGSKNKTINGIVNGQSWELDSTFTITAASDNYHAVMDLGVGLDATSTIVYDLTLSHGAPGDNAWALHGPGFQASSGTWAGVPGTYNVRLRLTGGQLSFKVWLSTDPEPTWLSTLTVAAFSGSGWLQVSSGANTVGVTPPSVAATTDYGSLCLASV